MRQKQREKSSTWVQKKRFLTNSRVKTLQGRQLGLLTTEEIDRQRQWWITKVQGKTNEDPRHSTGKYPDDGEDSEELLDTSFAPIGEKVAKGMRCKKYLTKPYQARITRTEALTLYNVIGVDFASPIKYRVKRNETKPT